MADDSGNGAAGRQGDRNNEGGNSQKRPRTDETPAPARLWKLDCAQTVDTLVKTVARANNGTTEGVKECIVALASAIHRQEVDWNEFRQRREAQEQRITILEQRMRQLELLGYGPQTRQPVALHRQQQPVAFHQQQPVAFQQQPVTFHRHHVTIYRHDVPTSQQQPVASSQQQPGALQGQVQGHAAANFRANDRQQSSETLDAQIARLKSDLIGKLNSALVKIEERSGKGKGELNKQLAEITSRLARAERDLAVTKKELLRAREQSATFEARLGKMNEALQTLEANVDRLIEGGLDAHIRKEVKRRMELEKRLDGLESTANSAATNSRLSDK